MTVNSYRLRKEFHVLEDLYNRAWDLEGSEWRKLVSSRARFEIIQGSLHHSKKSIIRRKITWPEHVNPLPT